MEKEKITIIGLGVIGGSLGMALSATGKYHVIGVDQDRETLQIARETGAISEGTHDYLEAVHEARVVFLAVPIGEIIRVAREIRGKIGQDTVVTDVGSTKETVVTELEKVFQGRFVGGHPMTGSELAGIKGADEYLFENSIYVLTPTQNTERKAVERVKNIVEETGARVIYLTPQEHDLIVAAVSHLPHLLAVTLMNQVGDFAGEHPATFLLAAGGFRDVTRIAAGHPRMWRDIYQSNCHYILRASRLFRKILSHFEHLLEEGDFEAFVGVMEKARAERQKIPFKLRGFLPAVHEVVVTVPDRPGTIAEVAGILGDRGINIIDIEILRVREGEGGSIRLAFASEEEAIAAYHALRQAGIIVKRR
ncbi:MAG: Prephenate dehydrogenase TyrA [Thermoanaerobacterales bacterium 50_218]|nr:MAG: Prephenate dehydrogenase TyrA [Thermoanaerobacterales bacterium 50_218]